MSTLRELKSRIGSVASTQKTTSAMKMISSAKMRKATGNLQRLSPYRNMVQSVISHLLVTDQEFSSPLIAQREVRRVALMVFGSDDGLCGAFNINIFKQLLAGIADCRSNWGDDVEDHNSCGKETHQGVGQAGRRAHCRGTGANAQHAQRQPVP